MFTVLQQIVEQIVGGMLKNPVPLAALVIGFLLLIVATGRPRVINIGPITIPLGEKLTKLERFAMVVLGLFALVFGLAFSYYSNPVSSAGSGNSAAAASSPTVTVCREVTCAPAVVRSTWLVQLSDSLQSNNAGNMWDLGPDPDEPGTNRFFSGGSYHLRAPAGKNIEGLANKPEDNFTDFYVQVTRTILAGTTDENGGAGLLVRSDDSGSDYVYSFDAMGNCTFDLYQSQTDKTSVLQECASSYFKKGYGQANVLGLMAVGNRFILYVNDHAVAPQPQPNSAIGGGLLGFEVDAGISDAAEASYANVGVWTPPNAPGA